MPVPGALTMATLPARQALMRPATPSSRVGAEAERIEEVVVDAAVDHVDALQAVRRLHVDDVVLDHQVAALDQLDAHLLGQEGVLEVGRVVDARASAARSTASSLPRGERQRSASSSSAG